MMVDTRPTALVIFKKNFDEPIKNLQIMTREDQNKILDAKIESNVNQYKVDRLNAEISTFLSGDLNKYEFLKRIDLNYKPNALDKARFEFSPLGREFNEGLDKTIPNYQEEGVIKLLKEIRDNLVGGINIPAGLAIPPGPPSSPSLPPSSPGSPSLTNVTPPSPPSSPGSPSLTNVTPLSPPSSPGPSKRSQLIDLDDTIKKLKQNIERSKKYDLNKLLKEQEQDELNELLENTRNKQEKDIDWDKINELRRKVNELTKNINSKSPTDFRTFAPRRDPFDDINKNKEKLTPPLSMKMI